MTEQHEKKFGSQAAAAESIHGIPGPNNIVDPYAYIIQGGKMNHLMSHEVKGILGVTDFLNLNTDLLDECEDYIQAIKEDNQMDMIGNSYVMLD